MTDQTFPKQQYTSIETAELDRLHARIAELEARFAMKRLLRAQSGPVPDYTGEGSAWVPPVEARAVVVCPFCGKDPEIEPYNWKQSGDAWGRVACRNPKCAAEPKVEVHLDDVVGITGDDNSKRHKDAAILKWNSLTIPADRVLGEGMVAVNREELEALRECADAVLNSAPEKTWSRNDTYLTRAARKIAALRANQGEAAT